MKRFAVALLALAACSANVNATGADAPPPDGRSTDARPGTPDARPGTPDARAGAPDAGPGAPDGGAATGAWLTVDGNRILGPDGKPFHGRGANLHDERSCEACAFAPRDPAGMDRWAAELIGDWHATFIRYLLSSKAAPLNQYEQQWESIVDDDAYFMDVQNAVAHMTANAGVYVLVTLFADPSMKPENGDYDSEWPGSLGDTDARYRLLAEAFYLDPQVLFGLTNEPHGDFAHDPDLAARYVSAIDTIRAVEDGHGTPHHIIVVQAPEGYARDLSYFVDHPLAGDNIAYEVHPYNNKAQFDALLTQPGKTLPILIGEYGPAGVMTNDDITALWALAQELEIPHIAWNFHMRCPPNTLVDNASDGCGLDASTGYDFPRTDWGNMLYEYLRTPW